ncbi:MAG: hypothetical protein NWE88_09355 [Candidatus Bathyarchaeota archaeon]|nr:hypothetical protein [Candidatus Bathyarchaeota archaeon]
MTGDTLPEIVAGLLALYYACDGSTRAHVPVPGFRAKLSKPYKQFARAILKKLRKAGYIHVHKGREESYGINMAGIDKLRELENSGVIGPLH